MASTKIENAKVEIATKKEVVPPKIDVVMPTKQDIAIKSVADSIVKEKKEIFVVLNPDGTERFPRHKSGKRGGSLPSEWVGNMGGADFVHNHPSGIEENNKGYGSSFSPDDIATASNQKLNSIVVTSPKRDYVMKPGKNGWPESRTIKSGFRIAQVDVDAKILKQYKKGKLEDWEFRQIHTHMVWKKLAKQLGMEYSINRKR